MMNIVINPIEGVITLAALISAIVVIIRNYNKMHKWFMKQEENEKDIKEIKDEQEILTYGLLACLKGLHQQGCNGPVTKAIQKIEEHLNEKAHD